MKPALSPGRIGLAVAVLAGASGLVAATTGATGPTGSASPIALATGSDDSPDDISGPCDETEHADDPRCTGTGAAAPGPTGSTVVPQAPGSPSSEGQVAAAGAGTVAYTVDGRSFTLVSAEPNAGWSVEVEDAGGDEIEVDFRSGTRRVQVDIELEDGQVRERVRARDDATGSDIRIENGVVTRIEDDHGDDDQGGSRGHGGDDGIDDDDGDHSGSGSSGSGPGSSGSGSSDD